VEVALAAVLPFDLLSVTTKVMNRVLPTADVRKFDGFFLSALKYLTWEIAVARAVYETAVPVDGRRVKVHVAADQVPVTGVEAE
jgi:hypothetical protein